MRFALPGGQDPFRFFRSDNNERESKGPQEKMPATALLELLHGASGDFEFTGNGSVYESVKAYLEAATERTTTGENKYTFTDIKSPTQINNAGIPLNLMIKTTSEATMYKNQEPKANFKVIIYIKKESQTRWEIDEIQVKQIYSRVY